MIRHVIRTLLASAIALLAIAPNGRRSSPPASSMVSLAAPARRVGFFLHDQTAASLTAQGWSLFDAAVIWVRGS